MSIKSKLKKSKFLMKGFLAKKFFISAMFVMLALGGCEGDYDINTKRIINADSEPESWLAHGRTYDEQRFSPLAQIHEGNVAQLGLAWAYETGDTRGLEASPIVVDGRLFTTGNWGIVHALDAKTGKEIWSYNPEVPGHWARYGCCDIVNRGVAVWEGKVYVASFDGRLIALDAETGKKIWEVNTIDRERPYTITAAPRIIKDKILIGNGGAELGVRGYVSAYDTETGEMLWRFWTVPGDPSQPFEHPEMKEAVKTWKGGEWWKIGGGGTVWDSMAYDPDLNLVYIGVGNGSPWTRHIRSPGGGDNLYLSSIIALDLDTGRLKWHYQTTPGDNWDYTATQHIILANLKIEGRLRKVLMQAPKNGFFYVIDRKTGELLRADPYAAVSWAKYVDLETGRPVENEKTDYSKTTQFVLPSPLGGHNWQPMAYHPKTGLVYIPVQELAGVYALSEEWKKKKEYTVEKGWWNLGIDWKNYAKTLESLTPEQLASQRGYLRAWDPKTGRTKWQIEHPNFWNGGLLATGGNLVFQGTGDGRFIAYRAETGEKLWEFPALTGIIAPPITYQIDGEQYVAVMAGYGGAGGITAAPANSISAQYENNGKLLVFKLGADGKLPEAVKRDQNIPRPPKIRASKSTLAQGRTLFAGHCSLCHGALAVSSGVLPDLRLMSRQTHKNFQKISRDGLLAERGMASFGDLLSKKQVNAIHAYIIHRATQDRAAARRRK